MVVLAPFPPLDCRFLFLSSCQTKRAGITEGLYNEDGDFLLTSAGSMPWTTQIRH